MGIDVKRGQAAAGAAVLIAIIAGLLIMFIVLVNPQDRAELLKEDSISTGASQQAVAGDLLTTNPGRIDYLAQKEIEHTLPTVNIYTRTEAKVLAERNLGYAKKGVFSEQVNEISFAVPDLDNTDNFLLTFKIKELKGNLRISLNEELIYDASLSAGQMPPLSLFKSLLNSENLLTFSVSSPGLAFWQTNEVSLENVKVIADVTSVEFQSSKNVFLVSETEKKNLDKVQLKFFPECQDGKVGKLMISINDEEIYRGIPDCGIPMKPIPILSEKLNQGQNEIKFHADKGTYFLSNVFLEYDLKEVDFPVYYFDLSYEEYMDVMEGLKSVRLKLDFVDVVAIKRGDIEFNGYLKFFNTKEVSYTLDLSDDVVKGTNAIKIKPKKTLDIRELSVKLLES